MTTIQKKAKTFLPWFLGISFIFCLVYARIVFMGEQLSFTNFMYYVAPWKSTDTAIHGPCLSDVADRFIPSYYYTMKEHFLSLWNSHISLGSPGDIWLYLYPVNYLYFLPLNYAMFLNSLFQFTLAFIGMYVFLRELSLSRYTGILGGICYTFSSALVLWHGWPHSDVAAWAPLLFFLYEKVLKNNRIKYWVFMSVIMFFMLVCGMPTYAAYFFYLLGLYILTRTIYTYKKDLKSIFKIFIPFALAVVLAAIASLPYTIELLSTVGANGYNESRKGLSALALSPSYLRTCFFPFNRGNLKVHINECALYNGILCIITLPFTFFHIREKKSCRFFQVSFVVVFLLIYTHLFDFIYQLMPAINTSLKYRNIVLLNFILAILFAFNMEDIQKHLLDFYQTGRTQLLMICIFISETIGFIVLAFITKETVKTAKNQYDFYKTIILFILVMVCLSVYLFVAPRLKKQLIWRKIAPILLLVILGIDGGLFAQEYLPTIERGASIIPAATDSITFLQENTKQKERFLAIGDWTMFPQTNMYYDLNDVRSHTLMLNTNDDVKTYLTALYPLAYQGTGTRLAVKKLDDITNYNLLRYLGCKYILQSGDIASKTIEQIPTTNGDDTYPVCPVGDIYGDVTVTQEFYATKNYLDSVSVRLATYGKTLTTTKELHIILEDVEANQIVCQKDIPLNQVVDDAYADLFFDPLAHSAGKQYRLTLTSDAANLDDSITAWSYGADAYSGELAVQQNLENDLLIRKTYRYNEDLQHAYIGHDDMFVYALDDCYDRVTLIDQVETGTDQQLLSKMQSSFQKHTMFLNSRDYENQMPEAIPLGDTDSAQITSYRDDKICIQATTSAARYLVLNDYYHKDWNVYIDGKKQDVIKANYLMRAVYIPDSGTHEIVFAYEPLLLYKLFIGTALVFVVWGSLLFFPKLIHKKKQL